MAKGCIMQWRDFPQFSWKLHYGLKYQAAPSNCTIGIYKVDIIDVSCQDGVCFVIMSTTKNGQQVQWTLFMWSLKGTVVRWRSCVIDQIHHEPEVIQAKLNDITNWGIRNNIRLDTKRFGYLWHNNKWIHWQNAMMEITKLFHKLICNLMCSAIYKLMI